MISLEAGCFEEREHETFVSINDRPNFFPEISSAA